MIYGLPVSGCRQRSLSVSMLVRELWTASELLARSGVNVKRDMWWIGVVVVVVGWAMVGDGDGVEEVP